MKGGAVQNSPQEKSLPEPSPWSPVCHYLYMLLFLFEVAYAISKCMSQARMRVHSTLFLLIVKQVLWHMLPIK